MRSGPRNAAAAALALAAAACASPTNLAAAGDIHTLMVSIRDDDQAAFDAHVDRAALETQLAGRLEAEAQRRTRLDPAIAALGVALAGPLIDAAADQLIQPEVFRAVAEQYGYSPKTPLPGRLLIARSLKRIDDQTVCVVADKADACVLRFRNEDGVWRLVGFEGDRAMLRPPH
jgi:hypothetical protein